MSDIGYSGQYLDNHSFKIKVRTGSDIYNATGDAIAGEIMAEFGGANNAVYVATETSTRTNSSVFKISDLEEPSSTTSLKSLAGATDPWAEVANHISLTGPFTVSAWVKLPSNKVDGGKTILFSQDATNYVYFRKAISPAGYGDGDIEVRTSGFEIQPNSSNTGRNIWQQFDPFTGNWENITIVRDSSNTITYYINGVATDSFENCPGTLIVAYFFADSDGVNVFDGEISEVAVWTSDQSANVNAMVGRGMYNLLPYNPSNYWNFGDLVGNVVPDRVAGNNITFDFTTYFQVVEWAPMGPKVINTGESI